MEINKGLVLVGTLFEKTKDNLIMFDMDGTLIKTKSKCRFPKDKNDWQFIYDVNKIDFENNDVVIITNQSRASNPKSKTRPKIVGIIRAIQEQLPEIKTAFMLVGKGVYRKPATAVLEKIIKPEQYKLVQYVGDAAGRQGDHSACDIKFAMNYSIYQTNYLNLGKSNIVFKTPEEFFLKQPSYDKWIPNFVPMEYFGHVRGDRALKQISWEIDYLKVDHIECLYICGPPKVGKTRIAKYIKKHWGYKYIKSKKPGLLNPEKSYVIDINPTYAADFIYKHKHKHNRILLLLEDLDIDDDDKWAISMQCIRAHEKYKGIPFSTQKNEYYPNRSFPEDWLIEKLSYNMVGIRDEKHYTYLIQYL
jgi:DNA 3'-phosphatase